MASDISTYQINEQVEVKKPLSAVLIMVCIYIFLVIERPWESIRYMEGIPIERTYAILLIAVAMFQHKFRVVSSPTNKWVYGLLAIHFLFVPFAFNSEYAVDQGIEYAKMVVLYLLILSVADDERALGILVKAYVFSTIFYALHSLWEYSNGRHVYRMSISRMIGVDSTYNDPNSFGATIVLSLPLAYAVLKSETSKIMRNTIFIYFALAITCVILTGSRTSFVALVALGFLYLLSQRGKRLLVYLVIACIAGSVVWSQMPEEKQIRFQTLWDSEVGPENAHESAEGRKVGMIVSWRMFLREPITGVGAGGKNYIGYRMANQVDDEARQAAQSHILYGEVLAELGIVGAFLFAGLIFTTVKSSFVVRKVKIPLEHNSILKPLSTSILVSIILLLIFGLGGHNFYRPLWLWLAAWSGAATRIALSRI